MTARMKQGTQSVPGEGAPVDSGLASLVDLLWDEMRERHRFYAEMSTDNLAIREIERAEKYGHRYYVPLAHERLRELSRDRRPRFTITMQPYGGTHIPFRLGFWLSAINFGYGARR